MRYALAALAGWLALVPAAARSEGIELEVVASGLDRPVHLAAPPGDARLFVVEQPGRIRIIRGGRLLERPFLDLTDRVRWGGERGLLSVAFHPRYAENGRLFVDYTDRRGDSRIERYHVSADPDRADPASGDLLLHIHQPYANHNGGLVLFGPDGMLWIGMGDGGAGGDPHGYAQDPASLLGKLLRIDVDHGRPYAIPRDNPFRDRTGYRPEIWALGLRNPWRFSFDRATGDLYIADVGQDRWEEVDVAPGAAAGLNYGWNWMEGEHGFREGAPDPRSFVRPALEYGHDQGCSITGGLVYRGERVPALAGCYLFSDYCRGWIRSFRYQGDRAVELREWRTASPGRVASFGEDGSGEAYVVSYDGRVYRIAPARGAGM